MQSFLLARAVLGSCQASKEVVMHNEQRQYEGVPDGYPMGLLSIRLSEDGSQHEGDLCCVWDAPPATIRCEAALGRCCRVACSRTAS